MRFSSIGRLTVAVLGLACALPACGDKSAPAAGTGDASAIDADAPGADVPADVQVPDTAFDGGPQAMEPLCDPLMPARCGLPWPSNLFLKPDSSRKTGYTLTFGATTLPANLGEVHLGPEPYLRLDGYSVGSSLMAVFPQLDISQMAQQTTVGLSVEATASLVWLELDASGKILRRIPYFVELDQRPNAKAKPADGDLNTIDPATQLLFVRPAVVLDYEKRYVVAFRNLEDTAGKAIPRSAAFQALIDGHATGSLADRQKHFDDIFAVLAGAGVQKADLTLAWDFVTGSSAAIHDRMLEMRDKSLAVVGAKGPELTVTQVKAYTQDEKEGKDMAFDITGTVRAPSFVKPRDIGGVPAWRFNLDSEGKLTQNGWHDSQFWMRVPRSCVDGKNKCDLVQYGHGLNGTGDEIYQDWVAPHANERRLIYFASNMIGMSEADMATILTLFNNLGEWPALPERVTQGVIEHVLLARTMNHRAADLPVFQQHGVQLTGNVYYSGNSQGGIYGQTVLAVNTEITRGHFGQPGLFYSVLLERSADFDLYLPLFQGNYPNRIDQALLLGVMQLLWDIVDPGTYARHIEHDLLANTPKHTALAVLHPGDFQVDPVAQEVSFTSGYYKVMKHYGRPVFGAPEVDYPQTTSAVVAIDFGNAWAAKGNVAAGEEPGLTCGDEAMAGGACLGKALCDAKGTYAECELDDPHDRAHGLKAHNDQMVHFFHTGEVADFCGGDGCKPE